jgi:hypothetical protein
MTQEKTPKSTENTNPNGKVDFSKPDPVELETTEDTEVTGDSEAVETDAPVDNTEELQEDELTVLKARAKAIGVPFHPNIGLETLRERIAEKLRAKDLKNIKLEPGAPKINEVEATEPVTDYSPEEIANGYANRDTSKLTKQQLRNESIREANKLVRIRVVNMNPNKREWAGEIITVSNSVVGTFRKFIPFKNTEGYHVPQIILQALRERQCQIFVNGTTSNNQRIKRPVLIPEFSIDVLPPLTVEELKELAQRQAMASGSAN